MGAGKIDTAFAAMIAKKGIEKKLAIDRNYLYQLRSKIKSGQEISEGTKLALLVKTGWHPDDETFTRLELVSLVNFVLSAGAGAKSFGAEYLVEKWKASRKDK